MDKKNYNNFKRLQGDKHKNIKEKIYFDEKIIRLVK